MDIETRNAIKKKQHKIDLAAHKDGEKNNIINNSFASNKSNKSRHSMSKKSIFTFQNKEVYNSSETSFIKVRFSLHLTSFLLQLEEFSCYSSNFTKDEVRLSKKLLLEDIEGELLWRKKLIIDAEGLDTGLRRKRDGMTLFGTLAEIVSN